MPENHSIQKITQRDVDTVLSASPYQCELQPIFGYNFDGLNQPAAVQIGCNLMNRHEAVAEIFKSFGFRVALSNSVGASDLQSIIVSPYGIKLPFMSPKDSLKTSVAVCDVLYRHGINVSSMVFPLTKESLCVPSAKKAPAYGEMDILETYTSSDSLNRFLKKNKLTVSKFIQQQLTKAQLMTPVDVENSNVGSIYRGGICGNQPHAVLSAYCKSVAYFSQKFSTAATYAKGLMFKDISYGFIYECAVNDNQYFYADYNIERLGKIVSSGKKVRSNSTYETTGYAYRNPHKATYLCVNRENKQHIIKLTDKHGNWLSNRWKLFVEMCQPHFFKSNEMSGYEFLRVLKEYKSVQETKGFIATDYQSLVSALPKTSAHLDLSKQTVPQLVNMDLSNYTDLVFPKQICELKNVKLPALSSLNLEAYPGIKLEDMDLTSVKNLKLPTQISSLKGTILPEMDVLDLSACTDTSLECADFSRVRKLILPPKIMSLRETKLPQMDLLDLSSCKNIQGADLSNVFKVILPTEIRSLKGTKLPQTDVLDLTDSKDIEDADFSRVKKLILPRRVNPKGNKKMLMPISLKGVRFPQMDKLDLRTYSKVNLQGADLSLIQEVILPRSLKSFSGIKMPAKSLDLSECADISIEGFDFSSLQSLKLPKEIKSLKNVSLPKTNMLDLSNQEMVSFEGADLSRVRKLLLPKRICSIKKCKMPPIELLDLSHTRKIEDADLSKVDRLILPRPIHSLKNTKMPQMKVLDLHTCNNIVLDGADFSHIKTLILPERIAIDTSIKIGRSTELYIFTNRGITKRKLLFPKAKTRINHVDLIVNRISSIRSRC